MTDRLLVALILTYTALALLGYLAWADWRGFDSSFCEWLGGCTWRQA